ncbi:hypothetical protein MRS44_011902 [Fusarium solani]|uniref:uncharacterized protein n=1 Tax=Fusarium solani TaxID=169388 RepID=UPI0032C3DB01|nr:hypothetical protein MRS44_011902 [Fusarium solani]
MATAVRPTIHMRPLSLDATSISAAAQTLSLSFATDPLITWLYRCPTGSGWGSLEPTLQRWQEARVREYTVRGIGMEAVIEGKTPSSVGVCFLFPPLPQRRWLNPLWWPAYLRVLWDQYWIKPKEPFTDEERIGIMMDGHYASAKKIKSRYPPNSLYYLEIAAVKPDTQGMGVGGAMMSWVVDRLGKSPCFLECTNEKNIAFYEKYGFKLLEEKTLSHGATQSSTTLYYMLLDLCAQAGMACEGYQTRLTWGPSNPDTASPMVGVVLNPVRKSRLQKKGRQREEAEVIAEASPDSDLEIADPGSVSSPDQLDLLFLQYQLDDPCSNGALPDDEVSQRLMDDCKFFFYMQSALSHYFNDLNTPEKLDLDETLATGVLLCSVSINSLYIWTPLLEGLHGVLQHRDLLHKTQRPPLTNHLIEVIGLLDIPCFTLNRITVSLSLWKLHVGPSKQSGVEQTSGLPYTLMTLFADLGSPEAENRLLMWPGELGDELIQIHLWEAFRNAGILHNRALIGEAQDPSSSSMGKPRTEVLQMKVFASIQAIFDSGAFTCRRPLARAALYPLFIAGLLADNAWERRLSRTAFQHLCENGQERPVTETLNIVTQVWEKGSGGDEQSKLKLATEIAAEMNVEIHLY